MKQNVARLEVSMDDTLSMKIHQPFQDIDGYSAQAGKTEIFVAAKITTQIPKGHIFGYYEKGIFYSICCQQLNLLIEFRKKRNEKKRKEKEKKKERKKKERKKRNETPKEKKRNK